MMAKRSFDLMLLDVKMPGMPGLEVLKSVRADHPYVGVVILSALADIGIADEALRSGACAYLTKPCVTDDLATALAEAYQQRDQRRHPAQAVRGSAT